MKFIEIQLPPMPLGHLSNVSCYRYQKNSFLEELMQLVTIIQGFQQRGAKGPPPPSEGKFWVIFGVAPLRPPVHEV